MPFSDQQYHDSFSIYLINPNVDDKVLQYT